MIKTLRCTFLLVLLFSLIPVSQAAFRVKASVQAVSTANTTDLQSQNMNTGSTVVTNTNASTNASTAASQSAFARFASRFTTTVRSSIASFLHLPYNERRGGGDDAMAIGAFACGVIGVGLFGLALGVAMGSGGLLACVIGIIIFGSIAFWGGLSSIQEGRAGLGWSILAMVLGCITILPPITWLCFLGGGYHGVRHGHRGHHGDHGGPRNGPHRTGSHDGR